MNKRFKLIILFLLVVIGITYYLQYNSLAKTRKELGLEYYEVVRHMDSKFEDYEKTFEEKFYSLNDEDIKHYRALLDEYNVIQDNLPNSNAYENIFTSLKESLSELKGINDLHIGTKAKIRSKILKDLHMLTNIYGLMVKEYDGSNEKYYKKINNKNSELNFQVRDYVSEWYDNYNKGITFDYTTIDSILRNNEKIRDITWASDKSMVLFMKANAKIYKAYFWRVGEENERFITSVSLSNYGFSWSPNNRYFLINEGLSLSTDKDVISTIISSESLSVKRKYHCTSMPIWSPVGNKLVMTLSETDKKSKWNTLRIYDLEDDSTKVILKSYNSSFEPFNWSNEGEIGYYEIDKNTGEKIEKIYKYDFSLEEEVYMLFNSGDITKENRKRIISALPSINWKRYEEIVGGYPTDILNWLYSLDIEDEDDIASIIKAIRNSDGAYSEMINSIIVKTYSNDKIKFIKSLAKIPEYAEIVGSCLRYDGYYKKDNQDIKKDKEMFISSPNLTKEEKEIAKKLLEAYINLEL